MKSAKDILSTNKFWPQTFVDNFKNISNVLLIKNKTLSEGFFSLLIEIDKFFIINTIFINFIIYFFIFWISQIIW